MRQALVTNSLWGALLSLLLLSGPACVEKRGEDAVYALFRSEDASFAFNRSTMDGRQRTIDLQTMGLLLEASKTYDEESNV